MMLRIASSGIGMPATLAVQRAIWDTQVAVLIVMTCTDVTAAAAPAGRPGACGSGGST